MRQNKVDLAKDSNNRFFKQKIYIQNCEKKIIEYQQR